MLINLNALESKPLPVYGKGDQVRDWLYVENNAPALYKVVTESVIGQTYNIEEHYKKQNFDVLHTLRTLLNEVRPDSPYYLDARLANYVQNRAGLDQYYAIYAIKIQSELSRVPEDAFKAGVKTVEWYPKNTL